MLALAENSSNFFEGSHETDGGSYYEYLVQSGYPCRRARFVKRTKYVDELTEITPWSSPWECQIKPSSYFEACAVPFLKDEEPENNDIDWSCFDVSNWFVSCEQVQVMDYTCPDLGEDPNTLEGCENSGAPVGCDGIPDEGMCDGNVIISCAEHAAPIKTTSSYDCGQFLACTCGTGQVGQATCIGPCEEQSEDLSPFNYATIVNSSFPSSMECGTTLSVSLEVQNDGTTSWTSAAEYKLGAVADDDPFCETTRKYLPENAVIAPGETHLFTFELLAPNESGVYLTDWQMVKEGVEWFGQMAVFEIEVSCPE
jgi:hypothetical protein